MLVVEQEIGERLGELGLADAGRTQEHERADRPVRILQPRARTADRGCHRMHRLCLPDHALRQRLLHFEQLVTLALEHLVDRNAGPARHDLRHVVFGHRLIDQRLP